MFQDVFNLGNSWV